MVAITSVNLYIYVNVCADSDSTSNVSVTYTLLNSFIVIDTCHIE